MWVQAYLTVYDGKLFFRADDGNTGSELWQYDASSGVASLAADINTGSGSSFPVTMAHAHTLARGTQHSSRPCSALCVHVLDVSRHLHTRVAHSASGEVGGERGVLLKWRTAQRSMRCALPPLAHALTTPCGCTDRLGFVFEDDNGSSWQSWRMYSNCWQLPAMVHNRLQFVILTTP